MERFAININKKTKARLYNICRLCGIDSPNKVSILDETVILSDEDDLIEEPLSKKILNCVGIQVTINDKMPKTICGLCFDKINDFFEFREMCTSTETQTRKLLGLQEIPKIDVKFNKTEIIIPNSIVPSSTAHNPILLPLQNNSEKKRGRKRKINSTETLQNKAIKTENNYQDIEYGLDDKNMVIALTSSKSTNSNKKLPSSCRSSGPLNVDKIKMESLKVKNEMKIPKTFNCVICNINFLSGALLQSHLLKSHVPQIVRYHCVMCNESINNTVEIKNHNLWHKLTKTPYKCGLCSFEIYSLNSYSRHIRDCNKHTYIQQKVLPNIQCQQCHVDFQTKNLFYYHNCITIMLKCPKCNCKLSNQNTTLKHIATCSVIPKNEFNFSKMLIKTEPLDIAESCNSQRSSVILLSETDRPIISMLYGIKEVIIKPCTVIIPYDLNLAAQRKLASIDMNFRKLKAKLNKRETAEAIKRCDELLKNTIQTLVIIKQEPADFLPTSINSNALEPMVRIKQEVLDASYGDCDIQVKQEIEELNTQNAQPILKLKIKNESGKLNSSIIEKKKSNKKDKKVKKSALESNKTLKGILNGRVAKHLPSPIKIKTEVVNPEYNYCEDGTVNSEPKTSNSNTEIMKPNLISNNKPALVLSSLLKNSESKETGDIEMEENLEKGDTETEENMKTGETQEENAVESFQTEANAVESIQTEENAVESFQTDENLEPVSAIESNLHLNSQNDTSQCISQNIKITSVAAGTSAFKFITQFPKESQLHVLNIKKEKEDPGYNRFYASEIDTNIKHQNTANSNENNFNENLMTSMASEIDYNHLPADFDFSTVHIKQEIEINEEQFNDGVESDDEDSDTSFEGERFKANERDLNGKAEIMNSREEVNSEVSSGVNCENKIVLNEGDIKDIEPNENQDCEPSIESSELKILKEKPFIEMKPYKNINSWDHCNNYKEYMPGLSSEAEINSHRRTDQNISEPYTDFTITQGEIINCNQEFNQNVGSLVISKVTSGNAVTISNFTNVKLSNHDNQHNENLEHVKLTSENKSSLDSVEPPLQNNLEEERLVNVPSLLLETTVLPSSNRTVEDSLNTSVNINTNSQDCLFEDRDLTNVNLPVEVTTEYQPTNELAVVDVNLVTGSNEKANNNDQKNNSIEASVIENDESTNLFSEENLSTNNTLVNINTNSQDCLFEDRVLTNVNLPVEVTTKYQPINELAVVDVNLVTGSNEKENNDDDKNNSIEPSVEENAESAKLFSEENLSSNEIENQPSTSYMANMTNINEIAENHNNENIEKSLLTQSVIQVDEATE